MNVTKRIYGSFLTGFVFGVITILLLLLTSCNTLKENGVLPTKEPEVVGFKAETQKTSDGWLVRFFLVVNQNTMSASAQFTPIVNGETYEKYAFSRVYNTAKIRERQGEPTKSIMIMDALTSNKRCELAVTLKAINGVKTHVVTKKIAI